MIVLCSATYCIVFLFQLRLLLETEHNVGMHCVAAHDFQCQSHVSRFSGCSEKMSYSLVPVENTPSDRAQIARLLVSANYEDAYFRTAYSFSPLPVLIENARLRLGSNLLNERAWFMKTVFTEENRDDGRARARAHASEACSDGEEGERKRGASETEHGNSEGTGEIVSYARWLLPMDVKEKLEKEYPKVELSVSELEELNAERRRGCDANGEPIGLNEQMIEEVGQAMDRARTAFPSHRPHMTLDLLATLPSHQRRGLSSSQPAKACLSFYAARRQGKVCTRSSDSRKLVAQHMICPSGEERLCTRMCLW